MALNIRPQSSLERKLLFIESVLNSTDKISKVSEESILAGIGEGVSKIAGKTEKDIILAVSQLFPDSAFGSQLDQVAKNFGIADRFGALGSSTYVRLTASPGTIYLANTHFPKSTSGIQFEFEEDITVGSLGFTYAKVRSLQTGLQTKVPALTISQLTSKPTGHINIVNEVAADGGRDIESDEIFRIRIKDGANILARGTLAMIEQVFMAINPKILKVFHQGTNLQGKVVLAIATQNGMDLSGAELDQLLSQGGEFFALTEHKPFGTNFYGIELRNIEYQPVDVSFRVALDGSVDPDTYRQNVQIAIAKYLDFRFFDASKQKIEWDNLLEIAKSTKGARYVPDQYFYPRTDVGVNTYKLPRLRGFLMLDMNGAVISNFSGTLSPVFYPNIADFSLQSTVLQLI